MKQKKEKNNQSSSGPAKPNTTSLNVVASEDEYDASPLACYFGAPENWLVDSGATDHMMPFGTDITKYVKFAEATSTTCLNVLGKGKVTRWVEYSPAKYRQIILENVLHVQGIQRRFLSTIQFQDRKYIIVLQEKNTTFYKDNKQLFSTPRRGRIIDLILYSEQPHIRPFLHAVTELPVKLWHERMGHLNWDALKKTQNSSPPLIGIRLDDSSPPHSSCEGCIAGKAKHCTFKSSASGSKSSTPIERIHSDLMGPMELRSVVGGFEYVCVFTCDCSCHIWVYLLKAKSQTFGVFKKFRTMIENLTGRKIKFFRSNLSRFSPFHSFSSKFEAPKHSFKS